MYSYGMNLISLHSLVSNINYHKNDDLFFRISYTECYPCIFIKEYAVKLLEFIALAVLDVFFTLILLRLMFGLKVITLYSVVKDIIMHTTILCLIPLVSVEEFAKFFEGFPYYRYQALVIWHACQRWNILFSYVLSCS